MPYEAIAGTFGRDVKAGNVVISAQARRHSDKDHPGDYQRAAPDIAATLSAPLFFGKPRWRGPRKSGAEVVAIYGPLSDGSGDWLVIPVELKKDRLGAYHAESHYLVEHSDVLDRVRSGSIVSIRGK